MPNELVFPPRCPKCGHDTFDDSQFKVLKAVIVCGGCGAEIPPMKGQAQPVRNISREQARLEIQKAFDEAHGGIIYYADLAKSLQLDIELVTEIVNELIEGGKLEYIPMRR